MLRNWRCPYNPFSIFFLFRPVRSLNSCPLPVETSATSVPAIPANHESHVFSQADRLIRRGLLSSAQQVIRRIINQSSTVPEAISAVEFALARGMELDSSSYGVLIRKLRDSGEPQMAETLYNDAILSRGIDSNPSILNSMVICYCKLGEFEEAKSHFDRILELKSIPCKATCNELLYQLSSQYRFMEAFEFFVKIDNAGISLQYQCYNTIIDGLCSKGYFDKALHVFDKMSERGVPPIAISIKSLILGFCKTGHIEKAESLATKMILSGFVLDKVIYDSLIHVYCKNKKMKMAMGVFFRMLKTGWFPNKYTYNTLIHGFVNLGFFDKGWILHNQMVELGLKPNSTTYGFMMNQYCKEQKVDCALTLLDSMSHLKTIPSVQCYRMLIAALLKGNRLAEVDELYHKMLNNGVFPDDVLFLTLLKVYPKGHELDLALVILQAVAKNGCGISSNSSSEFDYSGNVKFEIEGILDEIIAKKPNLANLGFSIYVIALSSGGEMDIALLFMDKMVSLGIRPLRSAYNSLIKCLCEDNLVNDAESLIELMQEHGIVPDITTYSIMVNEHCNRGDWRSAFDVLDKMNERGLKPGIAVYDKIIYCLGNVKRIFEAQDMFSKMIKDGVELDETFIKTMINAYSKNGWAVQACELFDTMLKHGMNPDSHVYLSIINVLIKKNMNEKACLYLGRMLENGFLPNNVFYNSIINQFLRKGEFEFGLRLLDLMEKSRIELDLITYITLMSGICRHIAFINVKCEAAHRKYEKPKETFFDSLRKNVPVPREHDVKFSIRSVEEFKFFALKTIRKVKKTQFMPNLYLYNCMISIFCAVKMMVDAYEHVESMRKDGITPDRVTFTILIDGHLRSGETERAVWLFNKMNCHSCFPDGFLYNKMIIGLCKAGRIIDALSVFQVMGKRGISPCKASYESLLSGLCSSSLSICAVKMCEDMVSHGFLPSHFTLNRLLCMLCEENKFLQAHAMLSLGFKTVSEQYLEILNGF